MPSPRAAQYVIALAVVVALGTAGCTSADPEGVSSPASASPTRDTSPSADAEDGSAGPSEEEIAAMLAERDAFVREQGLPLDGTPLVAVTPAQQDFIAQQRAFVEGQGGTWDAHSGSLALALAADACETSILNAHRMDATIFQGRIESSPLFATIIPADRTGADRRAAEQNVASVMVFGAGFLCPADRTQWQEAFREVYG